MSSKIILRATLILSVCSVLAAPAIAGEAHLYLAPYLQSSSFSGEGRISGGSEFNFEDTLGMDPDQNFAGFDGFVKFFGQRIQFSYLADSTRGTETLSSDFTFADMTFSSSERITTDIDWQRYEVMYGFDIGLKVVNFGFLFGAQVIDVDATVQSDSGMREQEDLHLPMPVVGATLGIHPIDKIAIHAKLSGMKANVSDIDATLYDGYAGIDYYFFWKFGLSVGYKVFNLDATDEESGDRVDIDQSGPYVSLTLHL